MDVYLTKKHRIFQILQGPIVVVILGVILNYMFMNNILNFSLADDQLVQLPMAQSFADFSHLFTHPDFSQWTNAEIYKVALVMAIVASLETLLCVEATDKLDPLRRVTPTNQELKAQGMGNMVSGLIGGLPITSVVVRTSANVYSGAKTRMSAIIHGFFLLIAVFLGAKLLNLIPLACLAAVLIMVGYKLFFQIQVCSVLA